MVLGEMEEIQHATTPTPTQDTLFQSQQGIDAFSSVIMVGLPLPPLPVCCVRGMDNSDAVMSSHDLIARCMASSSLMPWTPEEHTANMHCKINILETIPRRMSVASVDTTSIYKIFSELTREYIAVYFPMQARKNIDIRIMPVSHVASGDLVCEQARQHLLAHVSALHDCNEISENVSKMVSDRAKMANYELLLQMYRDVLQHHENDAK